MAVWNVSSSILSDNNCYTTVTTEHVKERLSVRCEILLASLGVSHTKPNLRSIYRPAMRRTESSRQGYMRCCTQRSWNACLLGFRLYFLLLSPSRFMQGSYMEAFLNNIEHLEGLGTAGKSILLYRTYSVCGVRVGPAKDVRSAFIKSGRSIIGCRNPDQCTDEEWWGNILFLGFTFQSNLHDTWQASFYSHHLAFASSINMYWKVTADGERMSQESLHELTTLFRYQSVGWTWLVLESTYWRVRAWQDFGWQILQMC